MTKPKINCTHNTNDTDLSNYRFYITSSPENSSYNTSFWNRLFNPIQTIASHTLPKRKKVPYFVGSILLGIPTLFIPHAIYWWRHRSFSNPKLVPKTIHAFQSDEQTVEIEQEVSTEIEKEIEKEIESEEDIASKELSLGKYRAEDLKRIDLKQDSIIPRSNGHSLVYFSLSDYMSHVKDWKKYAQAFEGLDITINLFEFKWQIKPCSPEQIHFLGKYQRAIDYVLFKGDQPILISQEDADSLTCREDPTLYSVKAGVFCNSLRKLEANQFANLVRMKFLAGISNYSSVELPILEDWIKQNDPLEMQELFETKIIKNSPKSQRSYQKSHLKKLFYDLSRV